MDKERNLWPRWRKHPPLVAFEVAKAVLGVVEGVVAKVIPAVVEIVVGIVMAMVAKEEEMRKIHQTIKACSRLP